MTKYRKLVPKHVEQTYRETRTVCDFCGRDVDVTDNSYSHDDIKIEARIGEVYPEGDFRQGYRMDVCRDCFDSKVRPALIDAGGKWHEFRSEESYIGHSFSKDYWEDER